MMGNNAKINYLERIAKLISSILDPRILIIPIAIAIAFYNSDNPIASIGWVLLLLLFTAFPVVSWITVQTKRRVFADNQVPIASQRNILYIIGICGIVVDLCIMIIFSGPKHLIAMVVAMLFSGLVAAILNRKIKISVHTGAMAGAVVSLIASWGNRFLPLLIFIPLIGWTRITLHRHSISEVIIGGIIGLTITSSAFYVLVHCH
jgi:membrane-associated phospholipid phosphatase